MVDRTGVLIDLAGLVWFAILFLLEGGGVLFRWCVVGLVCFGIMGEWMDGFNHLWHGAWLGIGGHGWDGRVWVGGWVNTVSS